MLKGVRVYPGGAWTRTVVMDALTGTIRWVDAGHNFKRLKA
jgi:fructose-1,6-bisphosphatase II / sedoheptulose-1,7-bisphosphatase